MAGFILKSLALWMSTGWSTLKVSGEKTLKMVQSTNITKKKNPIMRKVYLERLFGQCHHQTSIWKLITSLALIFKIILSSLSPLALFFLLILCIKMQPDWTKANWFNSLEGAWTNFPSNFLLRHLCMGMWMECGSSQLRKPVIKWNITNFKVPWNHINNTN